MGLLGRGDVLVARPIRTEDVPVPEWGEGASVRVRAMTGAERDRYEEASAKAKGANFRARLVAACACDADGSLIFTPEDVEALGAQDGVPLERLVEAALRLNAVGTQALEGAAKNS